MNVTKQTDLGELGSLELAEVQRAMKGTNQRLIVFDCRDRDGMTVWHVRRNESTTSKDVFQAICAYCGTAFDASKPHAKFCTDNHRIAAFRAAQKKAGDQ